MALKVFEKEIKGDYPYTEYWVEKKDGTKIIVYNLTEAQLLSFCKKAIEEAAQARKKGDGDLPTLYEAKKLLDVWIDSKSDYDKIKIKEGKAFSYKGLAKVIDMVRSDDKLVASFADGLFKPIVKTELDEVKTVASFVKESKGDFSALTKEDLIKTAEKMQENEEKREAAKEKGQSRD